MRQQTDRTLQVISRLLKLQWSRLGVGAVAHLLGIVLQKLAFSLLNGAIDSNLRKVKRNWGGGTYQSLHVVISRPPLQDPRIFDNLC
jgi:hypothetical protein